MNRIRQLRLAKGYSLDELANAMGGIVSKQALSKYERGISTPGAAIANKISAALGVKTLQLWNEPDLVVRFVAYRRRASLPKKSQHEIEAIVSQQLEQRARLQEICSPPILPSIPVESLPVNTLQDAETAAETIREHWSLGSAPIANLTAILEENLVHVIEVSAPEKFDGISAVAEDRKGKVKAAAVVSRAGVPGDRQRLSLAHELGHLVLKLSGKVDAEAAAFRFAGALLAPQDLLVREVGVKRTAIHVEELLILKRRFGMSMQALLRRMADLEIISQSTYKWRCIHLSKLGFRKEEPQAIVPERSEWLRQSVLRSLAEGYVSLSEAETMLGQKLDETQAPGSLRKSAFLKLPIEERRRILESQANELAGHYETDSSWRSTQGGDILEQY